MAWSVAGQGIDLVIVNGEPTSYLTPVQHDLLHAMQSPDDRAASRPSVTLLRESELEPLERSTLALLARVRLQADGRSLAEQMARLVDRHERELQRRLQQTVHAVVPACSAATPEAETPPGHFSARDGRYAFAVSAARRPPQPWINVLANPHFGCHVSEMAGGHTWADNSRMHQITRWSNDPVTDPPSEWLLLHDLASDRVWSLGRALEGAGERAIEHGIGFTRMTQRIGPVEVRLEWCVDAQAAVKQVRLRLHSSAERTTQWRVVALVEWQMGAVADARLSVVTRPVPLPVGPRAAPRHGLLATQHDASGGFGGATAWLAWRDGDSTGVPAQRPDAEEWTCDRREFLDASGRQVLPARLGASAGAGTDPCGALARTLTLGPGDDAELTLLLGHVHNAADAPQAIAAALRVPPGERLAQQLAHWRALEAPLQVRTPDAAFDAMVNHWLPYQTVACRLWARAGFFQNGGAFGFRDQLQDALSMYALDPSLLAAQLRICASRQFPEGDVQHWWHMPGGAGVRTHFSDDRLWLPYALAMYLQRSGDDGLAGGIRALPRGPAGARGGRGHLRDAADQPRARDDLRTRRARARLLARTRIERSAADGHGRLERRHEPRRPRRARRVGVARVVRLRGDRRHAAAGRPFRRRCPRRALEAGARRDRAGDRRPRLGRAVVPPRHLRRWQLARRGRQRRVPHRPDRASLVGDVGGR